MRVCGGVKESSKNKLVRSTSAGHDEKMRDEKLAKRAGAQDVEWKIGGEKDRNCRGGLRYN